MTNNQHYDVIVIGVGGMGSATCYELAKRGKRVLGLERFDIPHTYGSSHGVTRIIRLAYYEHPSYVLLLKRAYELWSEIEARAEETLLHITGSIDAGPEDDWVFKGALQSATTYDLPHEVLTAAEIGRRFPGYRLPPNSLGLFQPQGGFLLPERATVAFVHAAIELGAEIHGREHVVEYVPTGSGMRVRTDRGIYEAEKLVITAGAWDADLMPFLRGLAVPERQVLVWLQPHMPQYFKPQQFPVFNLSVPEGRFYGLPIYGVPGFKFGRYRHLEQQGDAEQRLTDPRWREPNADDEQMLRMFAERYFPDGAGPTMSMATCMFTNTPDGHFIIDNHPDYPQVIFASPCSGHGYKFASVIGEILAELAAHNATRHTIDLFRLDRLTGTYSSAV